MRKQLTDKLSKIQNDAIEEIAQSHQRIGDALKLWSDHNKHRLLIRSTYLQQLKREGFIHDQNHSSDEEETLALDEFADIARTRIKQQLGNKLNIESLWAIVSTMHTELTNFKDELDQYSRHEVGRLYTHDGLTQLESAIESSLDATPAIKEKYTRIWQCSIDLQKALNQGSQAAAPQAALDKLTHIRQQVIEELLRALLVYDKTYARSMKSVIASVNHHSSYVSHSRQLAGSSDDDVDEFDDELPAEQRPSALFQSTMAKHTDDLGFQRAVTSAQDILAHCIQYMDASRHWTNYKDHDDVKQLATAIDTVNTKYTHIQKEY